MNLPETIYAHVRALPVELQREALDFIAYLEQRYSLSSAKSARLNTETFIARFAGSLGKDFPDDIKDADMASDTPRNSLE